MLAITYATLPPRLVFDRAFARECPDGVYPITNCREIEHLYPGGSVDLNREECWKLITDGCAPGVNHEITDIAGAILYTLGIEWV